MSRLKLILLVLLPASLLFTGCLTEEGPDLPGVVSIVDEHADLEQVFAATPNIALTTTYPQRYAGDDTRFYKTSHEEAYVIYQVPSFPFGSFTGFEVVTWYNKDMDVAYPGDMSFAVSRDNLQYTVLTNVIKRPESVSGTTWLKVVWSCDDLPPEAKYLKIIFGDTTQNRAAWMIQMGRTTLHYTLDVQSALQGEIELAQSLLQSRPLELSPAALDHLLGVLERAKAIATNDKATGDERMAVYQELKQAYADALESKAYLLSWGNDATISLAERTMTSLSISWPHIQELASYPEVEYTVYVDGKPVGTINEPRYQIDNLKPQYPYEVGIVAKAQGVESPMLGPVRLSTAEVPPVPPVDFSTISVDDFEDEDFLSPLVWINDRRHLLYYFTHLHEVANAVRLEEPNRGFFDIIVHRNPADNKPYNARVQENQLWLAYFYSRKADWNPYYGMPELRVRWEAAVEHFLTLQGPNGLFSEYGYGQYNLAATSFGLQFLMQSIRLLNEAKERDPDFPFIDEDLYERIMAASRKAILAMLNDPAAWNQGRGYSNQYTLVWSLTMAYLEWAPEPALEQRLIERFRQSGEEFISPAGFYYEANGLDMGYNLSVHLQNLIGDYNYMRNTEYLQDLVEKESKFFDWLSYNLVIEPDGSYFTTNSAPSKRQASVTFDRKDIPLAEVLPIARAFVRTKEEVEAEIAAAKEQSTLGRWPNVPDLRYTGGNSYNPYGVYNRIMYNYHPTNAERAEAIGMLPYIKYDTFNHQRVDDRSPLAFTYIRRPSYYAIFNAGQSQAAQQAFGLGILWHPEMGILSASHTETTNRNSSRGLSWGTREKNSVRVYETQQVLPTYFLDGVAFTPTVGVKDLPPGEWSLTYPLGNRGNKTVTFKDDRIEVTVAHQGAFEERIPLLLTETDRLDITPGQATLTRGGHQLIITFPATVEPKVQTMSFTQYQHRMHVLTLNTEGELSYTIRID